MSPTALPKLLLLLSSENAGVQAKGRHHCLSKSNGGGAGPVAQSADQQGSNSTETVVVTRLNDSRENQKGFNFDIYSCGVFE